MVEAKSEFPKTADVIIITSSTGGPAVQGWTEKLRNMCSGHMRMDPTIKWADVSDDIKKQAQGVWKELNCKGYPLLIIKGKAVGNYEMVQELNEADELADMLPAPLPEK
eukprot:gb/GEZN01018514.1/.p1 GENE.gb/GEZN01018514.1/~~gb/GEZN01018514.1/.p1  ORF type:complete len:109 (+),score=25.73 gb/GEZN01018514.1/:112-438(+)